MTRRRLGLALVALVVLVAAGAGGACLPTASAADDALEVTSVSPWVDPEGVFQVRFGPSAAVPLDAAFSYTVHQRLRPGPEGSLRSTLEDILDGGGLGGVLQSPVSASVLTLGNPADGLVLDIPVRSERDGSERVLLPTPGVHPVELRLASATGQELWSDVVFLNRLPVEPVTGPDGRPGRVSVSLVLPVDGPPALDLDGSPSLDIETRAALAAATTLLSEVPEAPLTLALRPNVLSAVARSADTVDARFLQSLAEPTLQATVARMPYVAVDTGGLLAVGGGGDVLRQVDLGDRTLSVTTGRRAVPTTWYLDDTVSPEALPLLSSLGTDRVVVSPDRLRLPTGVPPDTSQTGAVGLQSAPGVTATSYDPRMTLRLTADSEDPAVRANQVVTELMTTWFSAAEDPGAGFPGPSSVIVIPAATDPEALRALVPALTGTGPLSTAAEDVPTAPVTVRDKEVIAALAPRTPPDQRSAVDGAQASRVTVDGFRSMTAGADPDSATWELLNAQTLSTAMDGPERTATHARIQESVDARLAAIEVPRSRRVVLTSREATIPLRFRNDLPYEVRLIMRTRSPRLEITGGETREIVLAPGENRIDLPVVARAPGAALLRIDLRSPDGAIRLPASSVPVTSSTISGVGAALSVLSLLFLAGWWIRTHRRGRRQEEAGTDDRHRSGPTDGGPARPGPVPAGVDTGPGPTTPGSVGTGG